jgi:hypothetical protein
MVHGGPAAPSSTGARQRARRAVPRGTKAHRGGTGRERATARSSPRPKFSSGTSLSFHLLEPKFSSWLTLHNFKKCEI